MLVREFLFTADLGPFEESGAPKSGKVNFCTGTGRKAFFDFFFGLILDPRPVHMLLQRKKGKFICTGHFFPHGIAFLEKRGGLVPVCVFIFPVKKRGTS